jgi:hypothetical protein
MSVTLSVSGLLKLPAFPTINLDSEFILWYQYNIGSMLSYIRNL